MVGFFGILFVLYIIDKTFDFEWNIMTYIILTMVLLFLSDSTNVNKDGDETEITIVLNKSDDSNSDSGNNNETKIILPTEPQHDIYEISDDTKANIAYKFIDNNHRYSDVVYLYNIPNNHIVATSMLDKSISFVVSQLIQHSNNVLYACDTQNKCYPIKNYKI